MLHLNLLLKLLTKIIKKNKLIYIGRTKFDSKVWASDSESNQFNKEDYYRICRKARITLLENQIQSLPVDLIRIVLNNGWFISTFQKATNIVKNKKFLDNNCGFTLKFKNKYYIFLNTKFNEQILNFTLAHEIGHILLNHFYTKNHDHDEKEANMFAARLLMPLCVLHECNATTSYEIQKLCNVSKEAATNRCKRLQLVRPRNKFYKDYLEKLVKSNFDNFILQKKNNF